jgi:hypothetical protein
MFARDRHYLDNFLPSATRPQARRVADGKSGNLSGMADWRILRAFKAAIARHPLGMTVAHADAAARQSEPRDFARPVTTLYLTGDHEHRLCRRPSAVRLSGGPPAAQAPASGAVARRALFRPVLPRPRP